TTPVRVIPSPVSSTDQNVVSLTQRPSRTKVSANPKVSNISTVRQATPSACPRAKGCSRRSTVSMDTSGNCASWAVSTAPAARHLLDRYQRLAHRRFVAVEHCAASVQGPQGQCWDRHRYIHRDDIA